MVTTVADPVSIPKDWYSDEWWSGGGGGGSDNVRDWKNVFDEMGRRGEGAPTGSTTELKSLSIGKVFTIRT